MPAIRLSDLELEENVVVIRPLRGDSDLVRSEKKYDRHGFGEVIKVNSGGWQKVEPKAGNLVIYDDSDAIEFPLVEKEGDIAEIVECVSLNDIYGVQHKKRSKK